MLQKKDIIKLGSWDWLVLEVINKKALILSIDEFESLPFNKNPDADDTNWKTCSLRSFLNNEFKELFPKNEQGIMLTSEIISVDNAWADCNDKIKKRKRRIESFF